MVLKWNLVFVTHLFENQHLTLKDPLAVVPGLKNQFCVEFK